MEGDVRPGGDPDEGEAGPVALQQVSTGQVNTDIQLSTGLYM